MTFKHETMTWSCFTEWKRTWSHMVSSTLMWSYVSWATPEYCDAWPAFISVVHWLHQDMSRPPRSHSFLGAMSLSSTHAHRSPSARSVLGTNNTVQSSDASLQWSSEIQHEKKIKSTDLCYYKVNIILAVNTELEMHRRTLTYHPASVQHKTI